MNFLFSSPVFATVLCVLGALALVVVTILTTWKRVPNDHAAVIVGIGKPKVVTGGGAFVVPLLQRADMITLETLAFSVGVSVVKTSLGVPINAEGYIILKVKDESAKILTAMQMFYCKDEERTKLKIIEQAQKLCEGKLREIVSGMTVEEIYDDREKFSQIVLDVASKGLDSIGLELKSFTINDITDDEGYIESLGKAQIAKVKTEAAIAQAESQREQDIKTAEAQRLGTEAKILAETQIAEAEKKKGVSILQYNQEEQTKKAISDAAYSIQQNITQKEVTNASMDADVLREQRQREVREAQINIEIAAEQKNIELAKKQAERKEAELRATVIEPAIAAQQESNIRAEANKIKSIKEAEAISESKKLDAGALAEMITKQGEAEANIIKLKGDAEATAIKQRGLAEAEALDKKAEALAKMNEAGRLQMVMDKLPEIAAAIAEPMSRIGNITVIGGGDGSSGASSMTRDTVSSLKAITEALKDTVGFDLSEVMRAQTFEGKTTQNVNFTGMPEIKLQAAPNTQSIATKTPEILGE